LQRVVILDATDAKSLTEPSERQNLGHFQVAVGSPPIRTVWSAAVLQATSEDGGLVCANVSGLFV